MENEVKFSLDTSFNSNDSNEEPKVDSAPNESTPNKTIISNHLDTSPENDSVKCTNDTRGDVILDNEINDELNNIDDSEVQSNKKQSLLFSNMIKKHINESESDHRELAMAKNNFKTSTTNDIDILANNNSIHNDSFRGNQSANSSNASTSSENNKNFLASMSNITDDNKFNKSMTESLKKVSSKSRKPWYSVFTNSYKQKNEDFRRLFKLPPEEHLLVDYSCALQREILAHGRLYVSSNHVCFRANIIGWETTVILKLKDIRSLVKDKTAKIIPNAITIILDNEKYFLTSFVSRDKTYTTLVKVWQNALSDGSMTFEEISGILKGCYGEDLGYNSDDAEYEYYSKLKTRPSDQFDLSETIDRSLIHSIHTSPLILTSSNLNQIEEASSYSDDQSNIKMKKEKNGLPQSSSNSSFDPLGNKFSTPTTYQPCHRQSSSYDTSLIDINSSAERPRSMVVEKNSQTTITKSRHMKTSSISSGLNTSSETTPELTNKNDLNSFNNNSNQNEQKKDETQNLSAYSPINNSSSSSKQTELSSSMIGQTSMFSPVTSSPSEQPETNKDPNANNNTKCSCSEHLGKELMNQVFNMSVNQLFESIFGHSEFCKKYWESRKFGDLKVGEWTLVHSLPARRLEYTVDLGGTLGRPKNTEDQVSLNKLKICMKKR
ncbi:unnamed protein product [Brachionus calyciflorus]|uniref:VASt domain-containing protein n=1 Tax=Brachionus calyciflorus TaxID=104777 RepID=A0A813WSK9_9BILA|nr:unnamed protein product [Brachionus calyciflorus]